MLSRNLTMFFYLKKRSNYKTGRLPIYIRITVEGQRMEISTNRECEPEKWNCQTGRKNGIKDDTRTLNAYLDALQFKIYEIQRQIIESNLAVTAELVRNRINGVADKSKGILEVFQDHNKKLEQLVGSDFALGTLM